MSVWYNEIDTFAAAWLRELIADGLIADGEVDERSILDVRPDDLRGFTQCHFFAGIGGWSYALRLAGWPDDRPVWTGSCPCQPLSVAGQRKGHADSRHLWPAFYGLIAECQPATVFGEQVASKLGREWLSGVRADLESSGYACGGADLCAAGVGAPHIRQRLWWVADAECTERRPVDQPRGTEGRNVLPRRQEGASGSGGCREDGGLADAINKGSQGRLPGRSDQERQDFDGHAGRGGADFWDGEYIPCADGKARRTQPGIFPLAHGVSNRVGTLRGAGNAIVPQVAGEFVKAFMETT
jgi:DNA (cytosine-5)-methyltransferase 1